MANQPDPNEWIVVPISEVEWESLEALESVPELPPDLADEPSSTAEWQAAADRAIEAGDYAAAAELRESAEESATLDDPVATERASAIELEYAAEHQARAEALQEAASAEITAGNYSAAWELSEAARGEHRDADFLAGGSDHSGQAAAEARELEWGAWHQEIAEEMTQAAGSYAADGNLAAAEHSAAAAADHAARADDYAQAGDHANPHGVSEPSAVYQANAPQEYTATISSVGSDSAGSGSSDSTSSISSDVDTSPDLSSD